MSKNIDHEFGAVFHDCLTALESSGLVGMSVFVSAVSELPPDDDGRETLAECSAVLNEEGEVDYITIQIVRSLDPDAAVDSLIHEWAHAVQTDAGNDDGLRNHPAEWGVSYAACYRAAMGVD